MTNNNETVNRKVILDMLIKNMGMIIKWLGLR